MTVMMKYRTKNGVNMFLRLNSRMQIVKGATCHTFNGTLLHKLTLLSTTLQFTECYNCFYCLWNRLYNCLL